LIISIKNVNFSHDYWPPFTKEMMRILRKEAQPRKYTGNPTQLQFV
jgi:predicted methyltransferase